MRSYSALVASSTLSTPSRLNNRSLWRGLCAVPMPRTTPTLHSRSLPASAAPLSATPDWILGRLTGLTLLPYFTTSIRAAIAGINVTRYDAFLRRLPWCMA